MIIDVIYAAYLRDYKVYLKFDNGAEGVVDLNHFANRSGVFAPLKDLSYFRLLECSKQLGTICWPNGADIAPDRLYELMLEQKQTIKPTSITFAE